MATLSPDSAASAATATPPPGARYRLYGAAAAGGAYNSHLASMAAFAALAVAGVFSVWLLAWLAACLAAAMAADGRSWRRKAALTALPGQAALYVQVFAQAARDALPPYALAFVLYVCTAPLVLTWYAPISSFVMLYGLYMAVRAGWLVRYAWLIGFRWEDAGRTFAIRQANMHSREAALRHILWAYSLGNVGLVVRCASQIVTIGAFEWLRQASSMDLVRNGASREQQLALFAAAVAVWVVTFWWCVQRALLIYYRTHRTFHEAAPLYDSIHSIHHRGVLPTPLDSGTISPAEFWITEMVFPVGTLVPNWWFALSQVGLAWWGHWPSHDAGTRLVFARHHLLHHRYFRVNFGLTQREDAAFGTLSTGQVVQSK